MTSYQRRKRDIRYYQQCVKELEAIAKALSEKLRENNLTPPLIAHGIKGDSFLTPYSNGDFMLTL